MRSAGKGEYTHNGSMYARVKDLPPTVQGVLRSVHYAKADIRVEVEESVSAPHAYGKGHRGQIVMLELSTGRTQASVGSWGGDNPFESRPVDTGGESPLPPGYAALTSSLTGHWTLHLNPQNVAALLPSAGGEVTAREGYLLGVFRLNTVGRKYEWERHRGHGPTEGEIASLASRGFLKVNRAGAVSLTTEGKNVSEKHRRAEFQPRPRVGPMAEPRRQITAEELLAPVGVKPR